MRKIKLLLFIPVLLLVAASCNQIVNKTATTPATTATTVLAITSKAIDLKGNAINPSAIFSTADKDIYVSFNLPVVTKKGDVIGYVRYFNDKYVNAKQTNLTANNVKNFYFKFHNKNGYIKGNYTIKLYYNKKFLTKAQFTVK